MNKHEQIVMRMWKGGHCFRTREHVVVHNGFSVLLLNNVDKVSPLWTYEVTNKEYDKCMKVFDTVSCSTMVTLPTLSDMRARLKGKNRNDVIPIDLTELQVDATGKYKGCLTVNLWYLYDFVWALGDNVNAFWSGNIRYRKCNGDIRTSADQGIYLAGNNGQAYLMPIERIVK